MARNMFEEPKKIMRGVASHNYHVFRYVPCGAANPGRSRLSGGPLRLDDCPSGFLDAAPALKFWKTSADKERGEECHSPVRHLATCNLTCHR